MVKLLACRARGPGFKLRSLHCDFLLPIQTVTEIKLKGHKSSIQPKINSYRIYCNCSWTPQLHYTNYIADCDPLAIIRLSGACQTGAGLLHQQRHQAILRADGQADRVPRPEHHRGSRADRLHLLRQDRHTHGEPDGVQVLYGRRDQLSSHSRWVYTSVFGGNMNNNDKITVTFELLSVGLFCMLISLSFASSYLTVRVHCYQLGCLMELQNL